MGEEWVKETYGMSGDEIDNLLYGAVIPTEDRQKKKIDIARKEDEGKNKYRMLQSFYQDSFLWDSKCKQQLARECKGYDLKKEPSPEFLIEWEKMYNSLMDWDMKFNDNGMKSHGWSMGSRVINKTTSLTTDDDIHERMLKLLESASDISWIYTNKQLVSDRGKKSGGHGNEDESFLENIESCDIDHIKSVNSDSCGDIGNTDPF